MERMEESMVAMYLEPYGYAAESAECWRDLPDTCPSRPRLTLALGGHSEQNGHTYYGLECSLSAEASATNATPSLSLTWTAQKRLAQLREELHETVKNELGKTYSEVFASAPFAKRGGWAGTSERLRKWLETLSNCVNEGVAPPVLVAQVLLFLGAPPQSKHESAAEVVEGLSVESAPGQSGVQPMPANSERAASAELPVQSAHIEEHADPPFFRGTSPSPQQTTSSREPSPEVVKEKELVNEPQPQPHQDGDKEKEATADMNHGCAVTSSPEVVKEKEIMHEPQPRPNQDGDKDKEIAADMSHGGAKDVERSEPQISDLPKVDEKGLEAARPQNATPKGDSEITSYLECYGFAATSLTEWHDQPTSLLGKPKLQIAMDSHVKLEGHTYYCLRCELVSQKPVLHLQWESRHRLVQLREELHDAVRDSLGNTYSEFFGQAPFARRGGLAGTTGRLQSWLEALAACVTAGAASPSLVALVLRFLNTPAAPQAKPAKAPMPKRQLVGAMESEPLPAAASRAATVKKEKAVDEARAPQTQEREPDLESRRGRSQSPGSDRGIKSDDETASAFSNGRRRQGYKKLRDWFLELKKSLDRKLKSKPT